LSVRHFLNLMDLTPDELRGLVRRAMELKAMRRAGDAYQPLQGRTLALVFEKSSTRTRVSFEVGMAQLGGTSLFLSPRDTQLGRGEPVEDTARVLSGMVDAVTIRTYEQEKLERFAQHSRVPVINALTDKFHPCQLLADVQTFMEHRGEIRGRRVAWVGDGNNMCNSYINAARQFGFQLNIASPAGYEPDPGRVSHAGAGVSVTDTPEQAVEGADLVVTDVWASMGQEEERSERMKRFAPYRVTPELLSLASAGALFMHCLPAHRGEEVTAEVLEGPASVVWDEAENRLHAQKALLEFLLVA
jgi:ornithine carbamoyltransferase